MYTNADSVINKRDELSSLIECEKPDVISISETTPKNVSTPVKPCELQIDGFDCFHNLETPQHHRGVAIWTRKTLKAQNFQLEDRFQNCKESVWCEIPLENGDRLLIGCVYRTPSDPKENSKEINKLLKSVTNNRSHVLITGDFNYPEINWKEESSPTNTDHPAAKFMEAVRDSFLIQHVMDPTHYRADQTPHVLDLVFSNGEEMIEEINHSAPLGKSHHHVLSFNFKAYCESTRTTSRLNFSRGDYDRLRQLIAEVDFTNLQEMSSNEAWNYFKEKVFEAVEMCIPRKTTNPNRRSKPVWMNDNIKDKLKKKRQTYQKYMRTRNAEDYKIYARARNQAKQACRKAVKDKEKSIAYKSKKNPKAFFAYTKSKLKTKTGIADLCKDGVKITDSKMKADILNSYFGSVFTKENVHNIPAQRQSDAATSKLDFISITKDEVCKLLKMSNCNKSPGPDGFHPQLLKELANELAEPLATIFAKSLNEGVLPTDWKEAQITPLFKKGNKQEPGNYRPVSLTSVVCKLLESLLRKRIINHLKANTLLSSCQHGFVSGRSCTTNLLRTHDAWTKLLDDGAKIDAVYLDFAKAFDSVPHQRLLVKLKEMGIDGQVHSWIKHFLKDRKQRVCVDGELSEWITVESGVPQGSLRTNSVRYLHQ